MSKIPLPTPEQVAEAVTISDADASRLAAALTKSKGRYPVYVACDLLTSTSDAILAHLQQYGWRGHRNHDMRDGDFWAISPAVSPPAPSLARRHY